MKLTLENLANTNASVVGEVTFTCPSGKGTSYTKQLSANQKVEKVLSHAFLESLNITEVYVKVSTSAKIYIAATIFDEEASAPDYACESAINFDWTNGHAQPAGEQWYRVDMATLRSKGDVKLSLYNDESSNTTVIAEVAFECPTTNQLLNQGVTLKASEKRKTTRRTKIRRMRKKDNNSTLRQFYCSATGIAMGGFINITADPMGPWNMTITHSANTKLSGNIYITNCNYSYTIPVVNKTVSFNELSCDFSELEENSVYIETQMFNREFKATAFAK